MQSPHLPTQLNYHTLTPQPVFPQPPPPAQPSASDPEPPTPARFNPAGDVQASGGALGGDMGAKPSIYTAVYSSIPVFECMVRGIAVMRRRSDSWMNATQILKVAGIEKGKRTKILEKDIIPGPGPYEKVQGGYGKYQGTWLPLDRALDLATLYGVNNLLSVLFDHNLTEAFAASLPTAGRQATPSKPRVSAAARAGGPPQARQLTLSSHPSSSGLPYNPNIASPFQPVPNIHHHPIQAASHGGQGYNGPQSSQAQMVASYSSYYASPQQSHQQSYVSSKKRSRDEEDQRMEGLAEEHRRVAAGGGSSRGLVGDVSMGPPSLKKIRPTEGPPYQGTPFQGHPHLPEESVSRSSSATSSSSSALLPAPAGLVSSHSESRAQTFAPSPASTPVVSSSRQPVASGSGHQSSAAAGPSSASLNGASAGASFPPTSSLVPFTRLASKPSQPAHNPNASRDRALLLGFFDHTSSSDPTGEDDPEDPTVLLPGPSDTFDPNMVIDSHGHTALHWACSLSRPNLVSFLLDRGADPHRGNYAGETALIRSVLATNNHESLSFGSVLSTHHDELSSTLRTLDTSHRSILHHIALIAGLKGRAPSARYYLETVLEWIAKNEGLGGGTSEKGFRTIVDIVDCNGDTALNIAARVGNRSLVGLLLSVQADKAIPNKMGLRAGDYGCEEEALQVSSAEEAVAFIREPPPGPIQKSKDVIADLTKTIEALNESFLAEIKVKQDVLTVTESHLRGATKSLSSERRRIKSLRSKLAELDQLRLRIKNVQAALVDEKKVDWTGRFAADGTTPFAASGSFALRIGPDSKELTQLLNGESVDPVVSPAGSKGLLDAVVELRRITLWQERVERLLEERISRAEKGSADKKIMFKKIIAICSNVPLEMIGSMLDTLITAVESDGEALDAGRVTDFMEKVRQQQKQPGR